MLFWRHIVVGAFSVTAVMHLVVNFIKSGFDNVERSWVYNSDNIFDSSTTSHQAEMKRLRDDMQSSTIIVKTMLTSDIRER